MLGVSTQWLYYVLIVTVCVAPFQLPPFPVYDAQSGLYTSNTHQEVAIIPAPGPPLLCKALVILFSTDENKPRALSRALNL